MNCLEQGASKATSGDLIAAQSTSLIAILHRWLTTRSLSRGTLPLPTFRPSCPLCSHRLWLSVAHQSIVGLLSYYEPTFSSTISTWADHVIKLCCHAFNCCYWMAYGQMAASLWQSHFVFSLVLLPGLWHRRDCLIEKQPTVKRLVFAWVWISRYRHQGEQITLWLKNNVLNQKSETISFKIYFHVVTALHSPAPSL